MRMLFMACMMVATMASSATPGPDTVTLGEVEVSGPADRERDRGPLRDFGQKGYVIEVARMRSTGFELSLVGIQHSEVRFRRQSVARRISQQTGSYVPPGRARLDGERVLATADTLLTSARFVMEDGVAEADGLPASIPFGPHVALVNLDYVRLRYHNGEVTRIELANGIHPQTRSCLRQFTLLDDGQPSPNRFVLLADTNAECRRAVRSREGDLLFADDVPEPLRQAVIEIYDPVAARLANRLGSEPGLIYVASWAGSPHGLRLENSWNRNSLLLFNGDGWERGLDAAQREMLRSAFTAEQIHRRVRYTDWPGVFTESATSYLVLLAEGEQARSSTSQLAAALPGWIASCASHLHLQPVAAGSRQELASVDCAMLVQFVYDFAARSKSRGRESIYDTWRQLLSASFRRGESGVSPAAFLASSADAHRVVQGLLDGTVDWSRFVADLRGFGVRLNMVQSVPLPEVEVGSLPYPWD